MTDKTKTIILNITVAFCAVAYVTVASMLWFDKSEGAVCKKIDIEIADGSPYQFVNDSIVKEWITENSFKVVGVPVNSIDLNHIEQNLRSHMFIDSVEVYSTMEGAVHIKLSQCIPLVRVMSDNGYNFFIDSAAKILPVESHFHTDLPIISGRPNFNFPPHYVGDLDNKIYREDKIYLKKITNFVESVYSDEFLRNFIVQIYINTSGEIELVPRIGDQIILFGELEEYPVKLSKLKKFYLNSFSEEWWVTAKTVNLKYRNQVIVS